jgi:hypothetical protein
MTNSEFWQSEAELEGKGRDGCELMEDFFSDMEQENERERTRIAEEALSLLQEAAKEEREAWDSEMEWWKSVDWEADWNEWQGKFKKGECSEYYVRHKSWQESRDAAKPEERPPYPVSLVGKPDVSHTSFNMGGSHVEIIAVVMCDDGQKRIARFVREHWYATRMEPDGEDCWLEWKEKRG